MRQMIEIERGNRIPKGAEYRTSYSKAENGFYVWIDVFEVDSESEVNEEGRKEVLEHTEAQVLLRLLYIVSGVDTVDDLSIAQLQYLHEDLQSRAKDIPPDLLQVLDDEWENILA